MILSPPPPTNPFPCSLPPVLKLPSFYLEICQAYYAERKAGRKQNLKPNSFEEIRLIFDSVFQPGTSQPCPVEIEGRETFEGGLEGGELLGGELEGGELLGGGLEGGETLGGELEGGETLRGGSEGREMLGGGLGGGEREGRGGERGGRGRERGEGGREIFGGMFAPCFPSLLEDQAWKKSRSELKINTKVVLSTSSIKCLSGKNRGDGIARHTSGDKAGKTSLGAAAPTTAASFNVGSKRARPSTEKEEQEQYQEQPQHEKEISDILLSPSGDGRVDGMGGRESHERHGNGTFENRIDLTLEGEPRTSDTLTISEAGGNSRQNAGERDAGGLSTEKAGAGTAAAVGATPGARAGGGAVTTMEADTAAESGVTESGVMASDRFFFSEEGKGKSLLKPIKLAGMPF